MAYIRVPLDGATIAIVSHTPTGAQGMGGSSGAAPPLMTAHAKTSVTATGFLLGDNRYQEENTHWELGGSNFLGLIKTLLITITKKR